MLNPREKLEVSPGFQQWSGKNLFFPVGSSPDFWEEESGILGEGKIETLKLPELFGNLQSHLDGKEPENSLKIPSFQSLFLLLEQLSGNFFPTQIPQFFPLEFIPGMSSFLFLAHSSKKIGFFQVFSTEISVPELLWGKLRRTSLESFGIEDWEFLIQDWSF